MTLTELENWLADVKVRHPRHEIYIVVGPSDRGDRMALKKVLAHSSVPDVVVTTIDDLIDLTEDK